MKIRIRTTKHELDMSSKTEQKPVLEVELAMANDHILMLKLNFD